MAKKELHSGRLTPSQGLLHRMIVAVLCVLVLAACARTQPDKVPAVVLGSASIPRVVRCAEPIEILIDLAERGRRSVTVLHMSSRADLSPVPQKRMAALEELVRKKKWDVLRVPPGGMEQEVLGTREYLSAAARLGLVREVIWVIPSRFLEYSDAERRVQLLLASEDQGFSGEEVAGMHYSKGCVVGTLSSVPVSVCGVETLPSIAAPVALDIDAGFFPDYAQERGLTPLAGIKDLVEKWARRQVLVQDAFVRSTLREETLSPLYLHIAECVSSVLEQPAIVKTAPPETWSMADLGAAMLSEGSAKDAAAFLRAAKKKYPDERSLRMLAGIADSLSGKEREGLDTLRGLCKEERRYCYALIYAGRKLKEEEHAGEAEKFFFAAGGSGSGRSGHSPQAERQ